MVFAMENDKKNAPLVKKRKKMTSARLKNIALYYLQRFDSSAENLRQVLWRRVLNNARENPDFDKEAAACWIEEIISLFERVGYLNDRRYAETKISAFLAAGKPERYIRLKMCEKGVAEEVVNDILSARETDEEGAAVNFARKKKIGPFREDEEKRRACRQKDLATMVRAGFEYDLAKKIIGGDFFDENL